MQNIQHASRIVKAPVALFCCALVRAACVAVVVLSLSPSCCSSVYGVRYIVPFRGNGAMMGYISVLSLIMASKNVTGPSSPTHFLKST